MAIILLADVGVVVAAVSKEKADELGKSLTAYGAIHAGNANNTIPAWTGDGEPVVLMDEQPLFTITSTNKDEHRDYLNPGALAMFERYPDSFIMNIYPSHRTERSPDWVYENSKKNALETQLLGDGDEIKNVWGGIPFPIPNSGKEVIWNHRLRWRGIFLRTDFVSMAVYNKDKTALNKTSVEVAFPFYYRERGNKVEGYKLQYFLAINNYPPSQAGGSLLVYEGINARRTPRQAWAYSPGQRRVRRVPNAGYDAPLADSHGMRVADEVDLFNGVADRYDWTLKGKQEMYISYNNVRIKGDLTSIEDLVQNGHPNPAYLRYEKHRVWVLEAKLKSGMNHIYKTRVYYIDEDTWSIVYADLYDRREKLWRVSIAYLRHYPELPVTWAAMFVYHDLRKGAYFMQGNGDEKSGRIYFEKNLPGPNHFSPAALRRKSFR